MRRERERLNASPRFRRAGAYSEPPKLGGLASGNPTRSRRIKTVLHSSRTPHPRFTSCTIPPLGKAIQRLEASPRYCRGRRPRRPVQNDVTFPWSGGSKPPPYENMAKICKIVNSMSVGATDSRGEGFPETSEREFWGFPRLPVPTNLRSISSCRGEHCSPAQKRCYITPKRVVEAPTPTEKRS